jgi:L-Ala-D/L-Glu epimerase
MQLSWQIVRFALKETFSIAYGSYSHRDALIVTLSKNGISGYGECTAIDYYKINLSAYTQQLQTIKNTIEAQQITHPQDFYTFLLTLALPSFLRSALDCAYWDLYGKLEGKSFLELNKIVVANLPESSITISVAAIETQIKKIKQSSWKKFKVKLNHFDQKDIQHLLATDKLIALDANGSFTPAQCTLLETAEYAKALRYIEQPLQPNCFETLKNNANANWMADEDCHNADSLVALQAHFKSINIKLVKCGGLTPALDMITKARALGFKIMIGCMTESTIGISAGAVLSTLVDYVDLDGANLIANDIANGSKIVEGKIQLINKPGLGITII